MRGNAGPFYVLAEAPRYSTNLPVHHESEYLYAIPLQTFKHWWEKQIKTDTRKKIKRPEKKGIEIKVVPLSEPFIKGVMEIFDETPVQQGKPFWHYGKDFEAVSKQLSRDLADSKFIAAYDEDSLVGFVKLVYARGRFANPG